MSRNRLFSRREPEKKATLILILCEGAKREPGYFEYFSFIDSRVNIEAIPAGPHANNSPTGLFDVAKELIGLNEDGGMGQYQITEDDELWFVIDTDRWGEHILALNESIRDFDNFFVAQSNPCFELWLYYHFSYQKPDFVGMNQSSNWKQFLNNCIDGGFNSKKHPLLISTAISNSEHNDTGEESPEFLVTHVYKLGKSIYELLKNKIDSARNKLDL